MYKDAYEARHGPKFSFHFGILLEKVVVPFLKNSLTSKVSCTQRGNIPLTFLKRQPVNVEVKLLNHFLQNVRCVSSQRNHKHQENGRAEYQLNETYI